MQERMEQLEVELEQATNLNQRLQMEVEQARGLAQKAQGGLDGVREPASPEEVSIELGGGSPLPPGLSHHTASMQKCISSSPALAPPNYVEPHLSHWGILGPIAVDIFFAEFVFVGSSGDSTGGGIQSTGDSTSLFKSQISIWGVVYGGVEGQLLSSGDFQ